jgi:hypothetical protein
MAAFSEGQRERWLVAAPNNALHWTGSSRERGQPIASDVLATAHRPKLWFEPFRSSAPLAQPRQVPSAGHVQALGDPGQWHGWLGAHSPGIAQ